MEFYTSFSEKRPVRLSEETRKFAYESLYEHKYGLESKLIRNINVTNDPGFGDMTTLEQYNRAIYLIATMAPLRICENEKLSGAATLGDGAIHAVPVSYEGGYPIASVSHVTVDFPKVLRIGINGIRAEVEASLAKHTEPEKVEFLKSCLHCLDCFSLWHQRYLDALVAKKGYEKNYENLKVVPFSPATDFYEAVQSLWFTFAFLRLCGNWPGFGRLDEMLGPYLEKDLAEGKLTLDEAREILAHFFIKGCEWVWGVSDNESGDAQHYQNIILSGINVDGEDVTNEVTYLVLDIIEELGIGDFPTTVRINQHTDQKLLRRVAEVIRYGGGIVAVYNEDLIIKSMTDFGYPLEEARTFANDGCWEVQVPGKTYFGYIPFDSLEVLQKRTLKGYETEDIESFEELYKRYTADLKGRVEQIKVGDLKWLEDGMRPSTLIAIFEEGCIESATDYLHYGSKYNIRSPHIGGVPDTANALYAIKKVVFDEKRLSFSEFMDVLKNNWEGNETLRQYILNHYTYFGNDNEEVDEIAANILGDFADFCAEVDKAGGPLRYPAGCSTFGRQINWLDLRMASPHGRKAGEILAGNFSPTPGTDKEGATAIIKSHCKGDLSKMTTGIALDMRLLPDAVRGETGVETIESLIRAFVTLGGYFMQLDVADTEVLLDAQKHPENYPALSVRVSGWNARFVTLTKQWQDMVINDISGGRI